MQDLTRLAGAPLLRAINGSQFDPKSAGGFYESWFLRANHPTEPLAFWIRYTLFSPKGRPDATEGQLWAIWFDGEASSITAIKQGLPLSRCTFADAGLGVRIGDAVLDERALRGELRQGERRLAWDLRYEGAMAPAFLLPRALYRGGFPKAKVLSGMPLADFSGAVTVNGRGVDIHRWRGSQNHNWGPKHTDRYAWGQVAGFDADPQAFLECSTARLRIGPLWTPWFTSLVLRVGEREVGTSGLVQALRNRGRYDGFRWSLECRDGPRQVSVRFEAPKDRFVALGYDDPPGGQKTCLNTKLASCTVRLSEPGRAPVTLSTAHRAAFEILTDRDDHGMARSA